MSNLQYEITIPVYNEEDGLEHGVLTLHNYLSRYCPADWSIAIADNGSSDRTAEVGDQLAKKMAAVRMVKVGQKGVGLALKNSWGSSSADVVGYVDLDMAVHLQHLNEVFQAFDNNAKIVSGSRNIKNSKVVGRTLIRTITSKVFNAILKFILNVHFTDGMCGFKFIKRDVFTWLLENGLSNDGWFFCTEMLVRAEWAGYNVIDIPVQWTDDGNSKVKIASLTRYYLQEIFKLRIEKNNLK